MANPQPTKLNRWQLRLIAEAYLRELLRQGFQIGEVKHAA